MVVLSGGWLLDSAGGAAAADMILAVRFLGTTPSTSSIETALHSICQQICYNLEIPLEEIPEEFVPLKNFLRMLMDVALKKNVIIFIVLGKYLKIDFLIFTQHIFYFLLLRRCVGGVFRGLIQERCYFMDPARCSQKCENNSVHHEK